MKKIISAAVTPFDDDGRLDLDSAARLYEFNLARGVDGFFIPGSMGEWALLTGEERDALASGACAVIGRRARVMLGIQDTGWPAIRRNLEKWSVLGHSHWVVIMPGGWAGPGDPVAWLHRLADLADRPLYLYYIPQFNGLVLTPGQFRDILAHPRVAGIKNSCDSIRMRREMLRLKKEKDFELMEGQEWSIDEALALGCDGVVAGFASTAGKAMRLLADHVSAGRREAAAAVQERLIGIYHAVYGADTRWWSAGQKYALHHLGLLASPRSRVDSQQQLPAAMRRSIEQCLADNRDLLV